jgi:hypothetical protein
MLSYVDDLRSSGASKDLCKQATKRIASVVNYLGMQDAPRKRRIPSKTPGAWAGSLVSTDDAGVHATVSEERWAKTRAIFQSLEEELENETPAFSHKQLLSDRGFLIYVARTYPTMVPYLKGLHLTIEHWRDDRDAEGWPDKLRRRRTDAQILESFEDQMNIAQAIRDLNEGSNPATPPLIVTPVPRLQDDVMCLLELFKSETPSIRCVRPTKCVWVVYGCGDASGSGFGSSFISGYGPDPFYKHHDSEISYRVGVWSPDEDSSSSNFRELRNLVESIEHEVERGRLRNAELFMFTDNSTAEAAYHKGSSSNKRLFELVLRLRRLEMTAGLKIYVIHISGKRMIGHGTDGLSRGNLTEGVMAGQNFLDFFPLEQTVLDRSPDVLRTIRCWFPGEPLEVLTPKDWYQKGHDLRGWKRGCHLNYPIIRAGSYLWQPAPAAAKFAIEELRRARLKRQDSLHVFVCPRLFTTQWRKQLYKVADLVFEIPCGALDDWDDSHFEPLVVGICFPFLNHRPWQLRNCPKVLAVGGKLHQMWKTAPTDAGSFLFKFCEFTRTLDSLSESLVWELLQTPHSGLFSSLRTRRRGRFCLAKERRREEIQGSTKWRSSDHTFSM